MPVNQSTVLIVDDDKAVLFSYEHSLVKSGYQVRTASSLKIAKELAASSAIDVVVLDLQLPDGNSLEWIGELKMMHPDLPVIVVTGTGDIPIAVRAMKSGAENFLTKPVDTDNLELTLRTALELGNLRRQKRIQRRLDKSVEPYFGDSTASIALMKQLSVAAVNDTVLLIQGETGTGKGVLSKWVHNNSPRAREQFVELNCSCLKGDLLRSELYGHAKGAFTSSVADKEGLIEAADKGTLFLDEIGDMDLTVQTQLLKTIEERTYRRVGENRVRKSDFRLICATNKDLLMETQAGRFRNDLYYRICVFPVTVPTLRERIGDLGGIIDQVIGESGRQVSMTPEVQTLLKEYSWPGNIRELRNMLERAMLLSPGGQLTVDSFPGFEPSFASGIMNSDKPAMLHEIEKEYLHKVVESCQGDKNKACRMLGISLATIYRKLGPVRPSSPE